MGDTPPKRWWTSAEVAANIGKTPVVNAAGTGFDWVTPGGGSSYLSFVAVLNQSGADEPVIEERQNTIGNMPSFRLDIGKYRLFGDLGTRTENSKIWMSCGVNVKPTTDNNFCAAIPVINNDAFELVGYYRFYTFPSTTRLIFQMDCYDKDFAAVDISTLTQNEINLPEIRVYNP